MSKLFVSYQYVATIRESSQIYHGYGNCIVDTTKFKPADPDDIDWAEDIWHEQLTEFVRTFAIQQKGWETVSVVVLNYCEAMK